MSAAHPAQHAPGQPQSKAAPTAQLTVPLTSQASQPTQSEDEVAAKSNEEVRRKTTRPLKENASSDPASLPATINLIQRVLAPDKAISSEQVTEAAAIEDILPSLTSSNEVDVELYAILAIIIKDFVNTWYTKITPDHAFVGEVIHIVAHCSRALEQRIRAVDVPALCLDEIPLLVQDHINSIQCGESRCPELTFV